jgi:hypothetical protein
MPLSLANVVWSDVRNTEDARGRLGSEERAMVEELRLEWIQKRRCYGTLPR